MRTNQSQEPIRSPPLYSSSSKGSIYAPKQSMFPNPIGPPPMPYNSYGLRQEPPSQTARDTTMSKSTFMKREDGIDNFVKEVKDKFYRLQKRLYQHEQDIAELKSRSSNPSMDTSAYSVDSDYIHQNKITHQIERIRKEISLQYIRKDALDFKLSRFQFDLIDKVVAKKEFSNRLQQIKDKTNYELQRILDAMRNQLDNSIHQVHDVNRVVFSRIEKDMSEMKSFIDEQKFHLDKLCQQVQLESLPMYPGSKKCLGGIRIVKYQQALQKLGTNGQEGEQIIVNECIYYLDRDGYLLDQGGYYLLNKMEQQIQLDQKQLSILRKHNLLL